MEDKDLAENIVYLDKTENSKVKEDKIYIGPTEK